jgi:hypothetical protein
MIVEGEDDKFAIIELMGHHTDWPADKKNAPVLLEVGGGASEILAEGYIPARLKESGTRVLGVVFDADEYFAGRWQRLRQICTSVFTKVPTDADPNGIILQEEEEGPRLGVWIMPNNVNHGMLETFLHTLIQARHAPLFAYAESVVIEARRQGAACKEVHIDKSKIHSWLAWQDPPGQALGRAITTLTLNPHAETARPFVEWFLRLYGLTRKTD